MSRNGTATWRLSRTFTVNTGHDPYHNSRGATAHRGNGSPRQRRLRFTLASNGTILITPATTSPAPDRSTTGNPAFNSPWSYTGLPTISIPTGQFIDGMPLAVQLIAGADREELLFKAAIWVE